MPRSVTAPDRFFEKLMKSRVTHPKILNPLLEECRKLIRPYLWFILGCYLLLFLPLLILVILLIDSHSRLVHLCYCKPS